MGLEILNNVLNISGNGYWFTRFVFLRLLGLTYFFAFLSLAKQLAPLLGENGLTPAKLYLDKSRHYFKNKREAFWKRPTIFWFYISDSFMKTLAWIGLILSIILTLGYGNAITLFLLWGIYISFVHIGQVWYGYGWESQLLETGFLAIFFVPLFDAKPFPGFSPAVPIIWLLLWLTFRLHLGSGLIKLRADPCWKDLTCLYYHFETQPIPNPLSRHFHFLPKTLLKIGVLWTHFVQIVVPFFLFLPGWPRIIAGVLLLGFQITLMVGGNYSFLNLVSIAPIAAAFNDSVLERILPSFIVEKAHQASSAAANVNYAAWIVFVLFAILSIPVIINLFSRRQLMNYSFNQLHLVNTYGAFGSVGRQRYELIIQGSWSKEINEKTEWKEYEFIGKPGNVHKTPGIIAPYQPRIDWQIWFAAMETPQQNSWLIYFVYKLLSNDKDALSLVKENPFKSKEPKHIRIEFYRYRFAPFKSKKVWEREKIGTWFGPVTKEELEPFIRYYGH